MEYDFIKRGIDIIGSVILLIIFWPVVVVTAVVIKLTSPGPVFADTPKRVGKNGQLFYPYKFRSMIVNAYNLLRTDPKFKKAYDEQQKAGNYKIKNDPRVTPVGRIIRKYSIDEIPQLLNVLKGEMSLVGPRPYYPEELELQQKTYPETKRMVDQVLSIKPGITGLWQVSGRSAINFDKRIALDSYYAKNKNFWMDLGILLKTPWAMVSGRGAV
jgi:lipopolysaccharide/colanic/teichoic acid biosynthesis glycosyltransferase